jgi:hypothetical protein
MYEFSDPDPYENVTYPHSATLIYKALIQFEVSEDVEIIRWSGNFVTASFFYLHSFAMAFTLSPFACWRTY